MAKKKVVRVVQKQGKEAIPLSIVAQDVREIGKYFKTLQESEFNYKTLVDLIYINCKGKKITRKGVEEVLRVAFNIVPIALKPAEQIKTETGTILDQAWDDDDKPIVYGR